MHPQERFFRPGEFLFHEGEPSQSMFLIKKGSVAIRKRSGGGFIELARLFSSEILGELSFFDRNPRSASAVALTEVEAVEISFENLDRIFAGVPDYFKTIIAAMAERLRKANETIRRLEKDILDERGQELPPDSDEPDVAAILAATADVIKGSDSGGQGSGQP